MYVSQHKRGPSHIVSQAQGLAYFEFDSDDLYKAYAYICKFASSFVFTFLKTIWEICQQFASFAYHVISESSQSPITLDPLTNRSFGYFTGLGLTLARVYNQAQAYATFVFYQTMLVAYSLIYIYQTKPYSFPYPTAIYQYNII